jgi:hypothetical protein
MEERAATPKAEPWQWPDVRWLVLLLALTVGLRAWALRHTEVAARDSIGFIRYALQFETQPWNQVVHQNHQHPGYPLTVLAVSWPVRQYVALPEADRMQLSAQLASSLASVLLIFPMYYLGKRLFGRRVGFWAALIFQCLPVTGHLLADGLSEALFLLLTTTTLAAAARALDGSAPGRFALCGALCGLTYLTRPEGALLLACTAAVLLAMQLWPAWRRDGKQLGWCALALVGAALVVGAPYVAATGRLSTKPSVRQFFNGGEGEQVRHPAHEDEAPPLLAVVQSNDGLLPERVWVGFWSLGSELVKGFHYVWWVPTILGMVWFRRLLWTEPAALLMVLLGAVHAVVLWRLEVVMGYLSNRHIQLLLLGGTYPAAGFLVEAPRWLCERLPQPRHALGRLALRPGLWSCALLATLIGLGLPKTLQTLHANRAGHHAAGLWLAQHLRAYDFVEDDHCWAHYYAGLVFLETQPRPKVPPGATPQYYTVVARARAGDARVEQRRNNESEVQARGATPVFHYPVNRPVAQADVVVYAVPVPVASPQP